MARSSDKSTSWKKMELHTLLHLLQPVEADWEELAPFLIKDHVIKSIKANSFQSDASDKALMETIKIWSTRTVREHRKWRTLRTVAERWNDNTLSPFLKDNNLSEDSEPAITDVMKWVKKSPLRVDWYEIAVELVGNNQADAIQANHSGGGNKECLRKVLNKWWSSSTESSRNWQKIVDALREIDAVQVIEDITAKCST